MKYGIFFAGSEYTMSAAEFAVAVEQRGFESIWAPEHTHIPTSRRTPFPGGGELPKSYTHTVDPFVALAAAAAVTTKIKLGTGVCLVIERDPIVLAKEVATLDLESKGRVILGIGAGWNLEEMENHGTVFKTRWKLLRERVEAMKRIWTEDEAQYHGEFVNFDPIWSYPKPVQKPYPPIVLGGARTATLKRVVNYCDGWMPVGLTVPHLLSALPELRRLAVEKGRDPKSISVTTFWPPAEKPAIDQLEEAGVERVVLFCAPGKAERMLPKLDDLAKLAG